MVEIHRSGKEIQLSKSISDIGQNVNIVNPGRKSLKQSFEHTGRHVFSAHLVLCLQCDFVEVMKSLVQTGLKQLMQGGPGQGMTPDPVHLQAQLEQQ